MGALLAFASGLLFACGLALSGMIDPQRVLGFLDFTGRWDPSLIFVMGSAVPVYAVAYRLSLRAKRPLLASGFPLLAKAPVDGSLLGGAALFGVGWGLSGVCPGPGLVALAAGVPGALVFCAAMALGMWLQSLLRERPSREGVVQG